MHTVVQIPGDGIGPEVSKATRQIVEATGVDIHWIMAEAGAHLLEQTGELVAASTYQDIATHGVALKGPITTPIGTGFRSINVTLRQKYDLFANIRPIRSLDARSPAIDFVIFRENTEDLYAGREIKISDDEVHAIKVITRGASTRITKAAFDFARPNGRKTVSAVHKANIMKLADGLFLEAFRAVAAYYPEIATNEVIVDNMCMQLVMHPEAYDVIVTENLYGDILSDLGAGLIGGLGLVPSANIGKDCAIFEAVHGSAPDIAGKGRANPIALTLSAAMMLDHLSEHAAAKAIRNSVEDVMMNKAVLTSDLGGAGNTDSLTRAIITGLSYELPIEAGTIRVSELRNIRTSPEDFGLMGYDPGLGNTAAVKSSITYIDGELGILRYRGYPIEELAERANYLEVAYLVIFGELPSKEQLAEWSNAVHRHTMLHTNIQKLIETFRYNAHPMSVFISSVASLATLYPDSRNVTDPANRQLQVERLVAKVATIAAFTYRHNMGWPINYPDESLDFIGNFLRMMFRMTEVNYVPNPVLVKALNVLFLMHADHEQNCSTNTMRDIGSSQAAPYSTLAGAAAALYGPLHGAANEAVLQMLEQIGKPENVAAFVERVKKGEGRLMGFGHRVYKNYDPRCRIIKKIANEVFEVTGRTPLLDVALELERIALQYKYFISRKLYPNVDFYSGLIYRAMKLPATMFTVLFAIPRTCGWVAHWLEIFEDPEQRLVRPRKIYTGIELRH